MAAFIFMQYRHRRSLRRNRIFRDRTHPLEVFDDAQVYAKFRLPRQAILELTDTVSEQLQYLLPRRGALTPVLQVLLALRFYATGAFQDTIGELIGVDQSTTSRTITRVTEAFMTQRHHWLRMPSQREADASKLKFYAMHGFPSVIGCVDCTHIRIQAPRELEHEFVNKKNYHSINVQVVCDADLMFFNVVAKWPGSVHDSRVLRESGLFKDFESPQPQLTGIILGDSGFMLRSWLMTPVADPVRPSEEKYNIAHSSTLATVERSISMAKQRWPCLRVGLRLQPVKVCKVVVVCLMLHNRARQLNIPDPPNDVDPESSDDPDAGDSSDDSADHPTMHEQARHAWGKTVRDRIIRNNF